MKAGDVTVTIRVVDEATPVLDRIAWKIMAVDGQWHREMMRADGLRQRAKSEVEAALMAVERNRP